MTKQRHRIKRSLSFFLGRKERLLLIREDVKSRWNCTKLRLKKGLQETVKIGIRSRKLIMKIAPKIYIIFTLILIVEKMRSPNGFIALAIEESKFDRMRATGGNLGAIRDIYLLAASNNLTIYNIQRLYWNYPLVSTAIGGGSLAIITYTLYRLAKIISKFDNIPEHSLVRDKDWQAYSLKFITQMTKQAIRYDRKENIRPQLIQYLLNTLNNRPEYRDAVARLVEEGVTLNAIIGLLSKNNDVIWTRAQQLLRLEVPKYLPRDEVPTALLEIVKANPPLPVPVPKPLQSLLGKTVNMSLNIAELKEISKAAHAFSDHLPTIVSSPAKLDQVLKVVNYADKFIANVEKGKLINVAEIGFIANETNGTNLTNLIK